jgi:acyl dehydratase
MRAIENITYEELHAGDYATFTETLSEDELILFAAQSGNINPAELTTDAVQKSTYSDKIGYGMWAANILNTAVTSVIPGPGTIHLEQELNFSGKVELGDTLSARLTIFEKLERNRVAINCEVRNQNDDVVVHGVATVVAPTQKISVNETSLPRVLIENQ